LEGCGSVLCVCKSEYIDEVQIDTENVFCQQVLVPFRVVTLSLSQG